MQNALKQLAENILISIYDNAKNIIKRKSKTFCVLWQFYYFCVKKFIAVTALC